LINHTHTFAFNLTDLNGDGIYTRDIPSESFDDGQYILKVAVMDRYGLSNSSSITVFLMNLLEVNILYPTEDMILTGVFNVSVSVNKPEKAASGMIHLENDREQYFFGLNASGEDDLFIAWIDSTKVYDDLYVLYAQINENDGSLSYSRQLQVYLQNSPRINITYPEEESSLDGAFNLTVEIESFEPLNYTRAILTGEHDQVMTNLVYNENNGLYNVEVDTTLITDGFYNITVYAVDFDGTMNSSQIMILIDNIPDPDLLSPGNLDFLEGEFTISARVESLDDILYVTAIIDNIPVGNLTRTVDPDTYSLQIDSIHLTESIHNISVLAVDTQGFSNASTTRIFMVDNSPSIVNITEPLNETVVEGSLLTVKSLINDFVDVSRIYINGVPMDTKHCGDAFITYLEFEVTVSEIIVTDLSVSVWYRSALGHESIASIHLFLDA